MDIQTLIAIVAALLALVTGAGLWRGRGRRSSDGVPHVVPPPPPEHTATEHHNESVSETADAVVEAADDHGVHPGVVAADLDWLESDDV